MFFLQQSQCGERGEIIREHQFVHELIIVIINTWPSFKPILSSYFPRFKFLANLQRHTTPWKTNSIPF